MIIAIIPAIVWPQVKLQGGKTAPVHFSSITQSCGTLCDPMDCSTPGFSLLQYLPEFTQTHVHRVSDALQPSHPLCPFLFLPSIFPGIGSFPMSQLFISGGQSIGASASVLPRNIQLDFLED